MSVLYSNTSTCYKRPLNSGNIFVDLIMRNHIWNGAIKKPLKIKYTYAQQGNFAEYLTYKDSFFLEMGCTYSAPYYRLAQITDPILQKLSTVFGPQYPKMAQYQTNDDLNTDFLYYAEDGSYYAKQGNFASSKQQCEYSKSLLQENFKRLALCHPDIIESEGLKPSSFINDIENIVPMKHKKFNEIYAETGKLIIEDPAQNFFRKRKYDSKYEIEVALDGESLTEQQLIEPDISLNYLKNMLAEIVNVEMVKTDNIHDANILFHLKTFTFGTGAEAHRDLVFFDQHKTKIAFLEGYLSKDIISWTDARDFQEAWHLLGHVFFDHPGDNNMIDNIDRERIYHRCGTVMEECSSFTPITLMPDDILALHHMYTANTNTRADDTVYTIKSDQTYINGDKPYLPYAIPKNSIYTLYDAGGKNTLDVTYMKNDSVTIDLNEGPGHLNKIGDNQFFLAFGTNIHKIKLSGVNSIVNMHSSVGCEIIVRETYNAKITNFHIDQDKVFFQEGFVLSQREDGFTAYSLLGDVIADIYYA